MVNIECTRCGATGTDYATNYVAKFSLQHNTGCGARVGIPQYSESKKAKPATQTIDSGDQITPETPKPKRKKAPKKAVTK